MYFSIEEKIRQNVVTRHYITNKNNFKNLPRTGLRSPSNAAAT